jgi:hypothetical protein
MRRSRAAAAVLLAFACLIVPLVLSGSTRASSTTLNVSPTAGPVGSIMTISGQGYSPGASITLAWSTGNASWVISGNPPEVTGVNVTSFVMTLATVQSDGSGSISAEVPVPVDFGGSKVILTLSDAGADLGGKAVFTLEPSFQVNSTSGPVGSPITVNASGLGYGLYSTNYHLLWDNKFVGYMTGVTTEGQANFTFYATGGVGTHYIDIYEGYPGPAYLNPEQNPPGASSSTWFPPLVPFHAQFTVTADQPLQGASLAVPLGLVSLVLVVAAPLVTRVPALASDPQKRRGAARKLGAILVSAALLLAGTALLLSYVPATAGQADYIPQALTVRPAITVPQSAPTGGPSITVSPGIAGVGTNVTVEGSGFGPAALVPVSWSTRRGNNIFGYNVVFLPLRNVTADASGSFSFTMEVPVDLGGLHYIATGDQGEVNASLYIERTASINATQGAAGSTIKIELLGVGWDYNTNILAFDYDNSFIGYACGFSSQGNVTIMITATGGPGLHTIDLYPSLWRGPDNTPAIYRYPLLTPQDHPESIPSFHFTYLVPQGSGQSQGASAGSIIPAFLSILTVSLAGIFAFLQVLWPGRQLL